MRVAIFLGGMCVAISLGLIYLDKDFQITDPYFKGSILGFGIGLFIGGIQGHLSARAFFKKLKIQKSSPFKKDASAVGELEAKKENWE